MVTSWYTSVCSLWSHTSERFLNGKIIQIDQFRYDEIGSFECHDEEIKAFLWGISKWPDSKTIQRLQRLAFTTSVHAEAALMGYAYCEPLNEIFVSVSIPWLKAQVDYSQLIVRPLKYLLASALYAAIYVGCWRKCSTMTLKNRIWFLLEHILCFFHGFHRWDFPIPSCGGFAGTFLRRFIANSRIRISVSHRVTNRYNLSPYTIQYLLLYCRVYLPFRTIDLLYDVFSLFVMDICRVCMLVLLLYCVIFTSMLLEVRKARLRLIGCK